MPITTSRTWWLLQLDSYNHIQTINKTRHQYLIVQGHFGQTNAIRLSSSWTVISQLHLEVYRTSIYITEKQLWATKKPFFFYSKIQSHAIQSWYENLALISIVGKSGFVSHTKYTAEATNMDLFHSWLIICIMWFSEFENKIAYLGAVKFKTKD